MRRCDDYRETPGRDRARLDLYVWRSPLLLSTVPARVRAREIDLETLQLCEPKEADDLMASCGLKMGSRKKIGRALRAHSATAKCAAIAQFNAQAQDGAVHQERLERALAEHRRELSELRRAMQAHGGVPRDFECPIR